MNQPFIRVTCKAAASIPVGKLEQFQGNLKTLPKGQYQKLRRTIERDGFSFPVFVWRRRGRYHIIDGHQRVYVVKKMLEEGYRLPGKRLPVA